MVQIAMLVCGVAAGLKCRRSKQAAAITLAVFAVVLVVQTIAVASMPGEDLGLTYWLIQAVSMAGGLAIARLFLSRRRHRDALV